MRIAVLGPVLVLSLPSLALGGSGGTDAVPFLNIGTGARPLGMAGAYAPLAEGVQALFYNPAGLAGLSAPEATLFYHRWLAGMNYSAAAAGLPLGRGNAAAVGIIHLGVPATDSFDEFDRSLGSVRASDFAASLGYARSLRAWSLGLSLKYVREALHTESAAAPSMDLGVLWRVSPSLQAGASAANLGGKLKQALAGQSQAALVRGGVFWHPGGDKLKLILEASRQWDDDPEFKAGAEWTGTRGLALRAGYSAEVGGRGLSGLSGLSAGAGLGTRGLALDYALTSWGDLGFTHTVSLSLASRARPAAEHPLRPQPRAQASPQAPPSPALTAPVAVRVSPPSSLDRAHALITEKRYREALSVLTVLSKSQPQDPKIFLYTGITLQRMGERDRAKKYFEAALRHAAPDSKTAQWARRYLTTPQ